MTPAFQPLGNKLAKLMPEEMDKYLHRINVKSKYIHNAVHTLKE